MRGIIPVILLAVIPLVLSAQVQPLEIPGQATELVPSTDYSRPRELPELPEPGALAFCLLIENRTGGVVRVIDPPAQFLLNRPGTDIGTVLHPASRLELRPLTYPTKDFWPHVDSSAVDAAGLSMYVNAADATMGYVELLPAGRDFKTAAGEFEQNRPSAAYLSLEAGTGIFGGAWPLIPGNPVSVVREGQLATFGPQEDRLHPGDIIIIEVYGPAEWPQYIEIQNRSAGSAALHYADGTTGQCATVLAPLTAATPAPYPLPVRSGAIVSAGCSHLGLAGQLPEGLGLLELLPYEAAALREAPEDGTAAPWATMTGVSGRTASGQPALFSGYLYAQSGMEMPRALPAVHITVQLEGYGSWQPLTGLIVPEAVESISAVRIAWVPTGPVTEQPVQPATPVETEPEITEVPSLRR